MNFSAAALLSLCFDSVHGADMTLDFSRDPMLKTLFDAGMRPYREPHSERFQVGSKDITARIILPSGTTIQRQEWHTLLFSVINDGRLTSAQLRSNPLTLDEAKAVMLPLLSTDSGESPESLDAFLQKVKAEPFLYEGSFHVGTGKKQNPMLIAAFSRTGLKETPLSLRVGLEWQVEPKSAARAFYKEPIPPPPGYENVSMEKPPYHGSTTAPVKTQKADSWVAPPKPPTPHDDKDVRRYIEESVQAIRQIRASDRPISAATQIFRLFAYWNPIGHDSDDLKAMIGDPTGVHGDKWEYDLSGGGGSFLFEFWFKDGKVVRIEPADIPLGRSVIVPPGPAE